MVKVAHFYTYDGERDVAGVSPTKRTLAWIERYKKKPVADSIIEVDDSHVDDDERYMPQAKLDAARFDQIVCSANFENVPMLSFGPTGKVVHLIKSWDEVDALVDRINMLALKAFGHHPTKPST